jgi:hypothetical protein
MDNPQEVPWKRIIVEATAIVASILLAFAIDAWWESSKAADDEIESLGLIQRDLRETQIQLDSYLEFVEISSESAISAYRDLSGDGPYDRKRIREELFRVDRVTVRIPKAAYTDILSTGNLRVISDRRLRDSIVRFYEATERNELVLQKNNDAYLDGLLVDAYFGDGLLLPHTSSDSGIEGFDRIYKAINAALGEDFVHRDDPLWQLAPDSREWNRLRSAVLWASTAHLTGKDIAEEMKSEAGLLAAQIEAWLIAAD